MKNKKLQAALVIIGILILLLGGIIHSVKVDKALENSALVNATVVDIFPSRSDTDLFVEYIYNNKQYRGKVVVTEGDFKRGDHLLIKIAKEYPDEYIVLVRKTN